MRQFDQFRASELFCPKCRTAQPVRERLLLVLPHAELYDYRCVVCASSLGQREVKAPPLGVARIPPPRPPRTPGPRRQLGGRKP